ncbi:MAG: hypothetical protein WD646_09830 [Actinomycetota bacterium]
MTLDTHVADREDEPAISLFTKVVAIFAVVGAGLGAATLIFLWATGFFDATEAEGLDALGEQFLGGIAIATVLVFALLVGVVLAALGGMHVANYGTSRGAAALAGALAGAVGHVALVAVLGAILVFGIDALTSSTADEAVPTPTPVETQSPEELASCRELFGQDSPLCVDQAAEEADTDDGDDDAVSFEDVSRIGLGLIPAALVGGLTAAILFRRRYGPEAHRRID